MDSTILGGAICGAVFTPVMGLIFEVTRSMATAMLVPLLCYVYITYAFIGSKARVRGPASVSG